MVSTITASIRLEVDARDDLGFISQADILERADTELSCPVTFTDPLTGKRMTKCLKPDALIGLEYKTKSGSRFRFYVVEADRGTEPLTSRNPNRKSILQNFAQYQAYISSGVYKQHLKLTSPLLVLNVTADMKRTGSMLKVAQSLSPPPPYIFFETATKYPVCSGSRFAHLKFLEAEWRGVSDRAHRPGRS